jgi:hypothetical protein
MREGVVARMRQQASDRLLESAVELSVDRYEMQQRAEADHVRLDPFAQEAQVLMLTGWVGRLRLWLARAIRPRVRGSRQEW